MAGSIARAGPSTPKREDVDLARDSRPDGSREGSGDGTGAPATQWAGQRSTRSMTTSRLHLAEMRQVHYFATRPSKTLQDSGFISGDGGKNTLSAVCSARGAPQRSNRRQIDGNRRSSSLRLGISDDNQSSFSFDGSVISFSGRQTSLKLFFEGSVR